MKMISTLFIALLLFASGVIFNTAAAQSDSIREIEGNYSDCEQTGRTEFAGHADGYYRFN